MTRQKARHQRLFLFLGVVRGKAVKFHTPFGGGYNRCRLWCLLICFNKNKRMWLNGEIARKVPNTHRSLHLTQNKGIGRKEKKNGKLQAWIVKTEEKTACWEMA